MTLEMLTSILCSMAEIARLSPDSEATRREQKTGGGARKVVDE